MRFGILGTLHAFAGEEVIDLGWPKQRALLAALLLTPNRVVSRTDLTVALWGPSPPASATNGLQKYVSALRRALGPSRLRTRAPGYLIAVEPAELDLLRFEEHAAAGRWRDALAQWRGDPCEDVELLGPWADRLRALREHRDDVHGKVVDERLAAGEHETLVAELRALLQHDPLREQHWARLMLAQHRAGRTAQAIATYAEVRALLADELGIDPGVELQRLHQSLLTGGEPPTAPAEGGGYPAWIPQCRLPLDVTDFVGRDDTARTLVRTLTAPGVPIAVVSGPPGVGKTALAVRVAHQLRARFPDGQWFVRLDGAGDTPRDAAGVLAELLRSSRVDGAIVPDGLDARAAVLRADLADRRVLIVLDDAASADQVQPLLPGTGGCAVLVTSRNTLDALTVLGDARVVPLGDLAPDESVALLRRRLHADQVRAEPHAVAELAATCGNLPLALRIAAANLAMRPNRSISDYVADLRAGSTVAKLAVPAEGRLAVRAAFDISYQGLPDDARRAFRLLALIPGPDFTVGAAAAVLDLEPRRAEALLALLFATSLVQEKAPGRFQFHDLIRLYAADRAHADEGRSSVADALARLFGWTTHTASNARARLNPHRRPDVLDPLVGRVPAVDFRDYGEALDWHRAELPGVMAMIREAAARGLHRVVWKLTMTCVDFFLIAGITDSWQESHRLALDACRALGEKAGEAHVLNGLGIACELQFRHEEAERHFVAALAIREAEGDTIGVACVLTNLSVTMQNVGRFADSEQFTLSALELAEGLARKAIAWSNLAVAYHMMGRYQDSLTYAEMSRDAWARIDPDAALSTTALVNIGVAHAGLGDHGKAREAFEETLRLTEKTGQRLIAAEALLRLGELDRSEGSVGGARDNWTRARRLLEPINHPKAADAAARLSALDAEHVARSHPQAPNG